MSKIRYIAAVFVKLVMVTLGMWISLHYCNDMDIYGILKYSFAITIFGYLIGDLIILPISNNIVASILDIAIAYVAVYNLNKFWTADIFTNFDLLVAAAGIGIGEWFFHEYVYDNVFIKAIKES